MNADRYKNGQKKFNYDGIMMTHFFDDGEVKAQGKLINGAMDGEWKFYKKAGYLWQVGHFHNGQREGSWIRYKADGSVEKEITFASDKQIS